ncbi:MAG TPA: S8 family serine peptidase, partial [Acidimicrobiales bacterium]|nr:S8 family serine peptidase [Acidimicrobiales bacterium]
LVAPGGDVLVDQNRDGIDDGVVAQTLFERPDNFCFCFREGMATAAAHVSGVAALVLAAGRAETPAEVRDLLVSTAADLGPPGPDEEYGAGLVQATRALGLLPRPGDVPAGADQGRPRGPAAGGEVESGGGRGSNPAAAALFGTPPGGPQDSGFGAWLRRRRPERAGRGALAVLGGAVSLGRRRRERDRRRAPERAGPRDR